MELDYFISACSDPSAIRDIWDYSKKSTSGSFIKSRSVKLTGISGNDNFSIFFSLDKSVTGACSLLSNWNGYSGYFIGFNDDNQLFVSASSPTAYSFYFPEIELAKKNCIAITKLDNTISIYRYDLKAKAIHSVYSKEFDLETNLSGKNFYLGFENTIYSRYGINGISGVFDQFACFNKYFGSRDVDIIFSGFLPIEKTLTTEYNRNYYKTSYEQNLNPIIADNYIVSGFTGFLNYLSGFLPTIDGNYTVSLTGITDNDNNQIFWKGYYYEAADVGCYPTGVKYIIQGTYPSYTFDAAAEPIIFENKFYRSINENDERISSHLLSYKLQSNLTKESYFSYNIFEKFATKTVASFATDDSVPANYLKEFNMNGIVVDKKYCNLNYYNDNTTFEGIGIPLPFDNLRGKFQTVQGFVQGYNLYWSGKKIDNYYISNGYIETPNEVVTSAYPMIFDKTNVPFIRFAASYGIASTTNQSVDVRYFSIGSPVVFVGDALDRVNTRIFNNFRQISLLNLINGKNDNIENNKENWTNFITNDSLYWESYNLTLPQL